MKKQKIKLSEGKLNKIISEAFKKYIKESSSNESVLDAWSETKNIMGCEGMLDAIEAALSHDQIVDLLKYFNRIYELGLDLSDIY